MLFRSDRETAGVLGAELQAGHGRRRGGELRRRLIGTRIWARVCEGGIHNEPRTSEDQVNQDADGSRPVLMTSWSEWQGQRRFKEPGPRQGGGLRQRFEAATQDKGSRPRFKAKVENKHSRQRSKAKVQDQDSRQRFKTMSRERCVDECHGSAIRSVR